MLLYFLMAPHVHFHQFTPPIPLGHHRSVGLPAFSVLVKLLHLVLVEGKRSINDQVINFVPPPPRAMADPFFMVSTPLNDPNGRACSIWLRPNRA